MPSAAHRVHHRGYSGARHGPCQARARGLEIAADRPQLSGDHHPDACKIGIMPGHIHQRGAIGIVSRSGTLTYEAVAQTTAADSVRAPASASAATRSTAPASSTAWSCSWRIRDRGGRYDRRDRRDGRGRCRVPARRRNRKPVVGFIAGRTAPPGRRMGHAGAIIAGGKGGAGRRSRRCAPPGSPSPTVRGNRCDHARGDARLMQILTPPWHLRLRGGLAGGMTHGRLDGQATRDRADRLPVRRQQRLHRRPLRPLPRDPAAVDLSWRAYFDELGRDAPCSSAAKRRCRRADQDSLANLSSAPEPRSSISAVSARVD